MAYLRQPILNSFSLTKAVYLATIGSKALTEAIQFSQHVSLFSILETIYPVIFKNASKTNIKI